MILLHIHANNETQAELITRKLTEEKLIYKMYQLENSFEFNTEYKNAKIEKCVILQAPTKTLLFKRIEQVINEICKNDIPLFYGVPITSFCEAHADSIINSTEGH